MNTEITNIIDTRALRGWIFYDACAVGVILAVFWTARLLVAVLVFDLKPYLGNLLWKIGYHATNTVFILLPLLYGWVAFAGGAR